MENNKNSVANNQAVFDERAAVLAKAEESMQSDSREMLFVFYVGDEKYGIYSTLVSKVIPFQAMTPMPCAPDNVPGVLYYGGEIWPVLDAEHIFHQNKAAGSALNYILLKNGDIKMALAIGVIQGEEYCDSKAELTKLATKQASDQVIIHGIYREEIAIIDIKNLGLLLTAGV